MYGAAHVLKVLTRRQLRAYFSFRHGNAADAQHPREGWLREPSVPYRLVHLQAGETVHHPANPLGVDPTQYAGLIILEVVTHLGIGRLALLVRHSLFLNLRIHSGAIHSVRKVGA